MMSKGKLPESVQRNLQNGMSPEEAYKRYKIDSKSDILSIVSGILVLVGIVYTVLPVDIVSDVIVPWGFIDDGIIDIIIIIINIINGLEQGKKHQVEEQLKALQQSGVAMLERTSEKRDRVKTTENTNKANNGISDLDLF